MSWNSGPCLGGPDWPRLNRSGYWTRGEAGPAGDEPAPDLTDPATVDDLDESPGGDDVPGTERP